MIKTEIRKDNQEYLWQFITDWRHEPVSGWQYHIWWCSSEKKLVISTSERSRYGRYLFWKELWNEKWECATAKEAKKILNNWKSERGLSS